MSIHDGHRNRMKNRFLKDGLDNFEEHEVLELLLYYCIPRQDTNPIAHRLLQHFGTVSRVLEAPASELKKVEGIGENAAIFLNLVNDIGRYHQVNRITQNRILRSLEQCGAFVAPYFYGRRNETVFMLCMDAKCKVLCCKEVSEGSVSFATVPIRRLVETALAVNAVSVVLAHNHPSGIALPSDEDICTTKRAAIALSSVDIQLVDHVIVADDDYISMAQSGLYRPEDCVPLV